MTFSNFGMFAASGLAILVGMVILEGAAPQYLVPLALILFLSAWLVYDRSHDGALTQQLASIAGLIGGQS